MEHRHLEFRSATPVRTETLHGLTRIQASIAPLVEKARQKQIAEWSDFAAVNTYARRLFLSVLHHNQLIDVSEGRAYLKKSDLAPIPQYHQFTSALESIVIKDGHEPPWDSSTLHAFRQATTVAHADVVPHLDFIDMASCCFVKVVRGQMTASEALLNAPGLQHLKGIFRDNAGADFTNKLIAIAATSLSQGWSENGEPVNILELGAGTGGATAHCLAALARESLSVTYTVTDITQSFVQRNQAAFRNEFPFTRFRRFDIESPAEPQGFSLDSCDLIIASNVIHATKNIEQTLINIASLIKPGGVLLVNENNVYQDFTTLTFGLLDRWWSASDSEIRIPHSPLLRTETWFPLLGRAGFEVTLLTTPLANGSQAFSQNLFYAYKPRE